MRIRFVESTRYLATGRLLKARRLLYPSLTFPLLAALAPGDVEVSMSHELVEEVPLDDRPDLVAMTGVTNNILRTYEIADEYRRRGVTVAIGGFHVSAEPAEALDHADVVFVGEAEETWPHFLADYRAGRHARLYEAGAPPPLDRLPVPRLSIVNPDHYLGYGSGPLVRRLLPPAIPVQTARGCPNGCAFCDVARFHRGTYRARPVAAVVNEIRALGARRVCFVDDNITADPGRAKSLFRAIAPLRLSWFGQATAAMADDPELLALARSSGCETLLVGVESVCEGSLASVGKDRLNRPDLLAPRLRAFREAGIDVNASMTFGFDADRPSVFRDTHEFLVRHRVPYAGWQPLRPSPATPLLARLKAEGRLDREAWWLDREAVGRVFHLKFRHPQIGRDEFALGCFEWYRKFYSLSSVARRLLVPPQRRLFTKLAVMAACRRKISPHAFISEH